MKKKITLLNLTDEIEVEKARAIFEGSQLGLFNSFKRKIFKNKYYVKVQFVSKETAYLMLSINMCDFFVAARFDMSSYGQQNRGELEKILKDFTQDNDFDRLLHHCSSFSISLEDRKALAWKTWFNHPQKSRIFEPRDHLDYKNNIFSFGNKDEFHKNMSRLLEQRTLPKRWFIGSRYCLSFLGFYIDGEIKFVSIMTLTGNDLFILNTFEDENEAFRHREILNPIVSDLGATNDRRPLVKYFNEYGKSFDFSETEDILRVVTDQVFAVSKEKDITQDFSVSQSFEGLG